jgi:Histidine phosphatase superfamily (branch 1)
MSNSLLSGSRMRPPSGRPVLADDPWLGLAGCFQPLRRARQTAQMVSARLGLPVAAELDDRREVNVGELDGRADDCAWRV